MMYIPLPALQLIQDWILFVIVFVIVLMDSTILLVGTSIPQNRLNATLVPDEEHGAGVNVSSQCAIYVCILMKLVLLL